MKWTDEQITKILKAAAKDPNVLPWSERAWDKIESRLAARETKGFWKQINPWGRPYRMALAATSFCAVMVGVFTYQQSAYQADLASYMLNVTDPQVSVSEDYGVVKTSVLLSSEGSSSKELGTVKVPVLLGDDNQAPIQDVSFSGSDEDDILLQI